MNAAEYQRMFLVESRHWWYVALHELVLHEVQGYAAGRSLDIYDAGCGTGRLAELLVPYGSVSGCDASAQAIDFCRQRGMAGVVQGDLQTVDVPQAGFDLITCIDVLYHQGITDDVAVLKRLHKALRPNGMLLLNLVAFPSLYSAHDVAVHTRERYTRPVLRQRLLSAGFTVERLTYRVSALFPLIWVWRWLRRHALQRLQPAAQNQIASDLSMPSSMLNSGLLALMRLENRFLAHVNLPFGSSLFAVCRKEG